MADKAGSIRGEWAQKLLGRINLALVAMALIVNIGACWKVYRYEPLREAGSRALMAANSRFIFDSGLAEPAPVAALKAAMAAGADPDAALRVEGLAVFAAVTWLTLFVLAKRVGRIAGLMGALFLAANPYMGFYAMQGSSHLYALFPLLLFWYYLTAPAASARSALLAGLFAGLACLSRLDCAFVILLLAGLRLAPRRVPGGLRSIAIALALCAALTSPYLAYQGARYGNIFYGQELRLRRWANIDRYGYRPAGDVPSSPLGTAGFVFRNGPSGALRGLFSGLWRAFAHELPRALYYKFMMVLVFLGFYAAAALKKNFLIFFFAAALLPAIPLAPIRQFAATGGIELRYYLWALWGMCALAGFGFQETLGWLEKTLGEKYGAAGGA